MRVFTRIALAFLAAAVLAQPVFSQPSQSNCPLTLVATNPPSSGISGSPHGVFRSGSLVYVVRGQFVTTYTVTDLGDMQIARDDFIVGLAGRNIGATAFANGFLYVASEAGIEIVDLRNVKPGGSAPQVLSRIAGVNYRRLAISGTTLAALYPATDMPCNPGIFCPTQVDLYNVASSSAPFRVSTITSQSSIIGGFNDIAFNFGYLIVTGTAGTVAYDLSNLGAPRITGNSGTIGTFLVSDGAGFLGIGNSMAIITYAITNPFGIFTPLTYHSLATLQVGRANPIAYHPQAYIDNINNRLITLVDELDPERLTPARTIAFDVFDYTVPMIEGKDPRTYESISYLETDEVKHNPVAVGPLVYVIGDVSGLQTYGDCGQMAGKIESDNIAALPCGGAEIHGWVTGAQKITGVELFLDSTDLGPATISTIPRIDVPSKTPVFTWRIGVLLDQTSKGVHTLRVTGTDVNNNTRQFFSEPIFFPGPGQNCFNRRRTTGH